MKQNSSHKKQRASYHSSNSVSRSVNRTLGQLALGERMRSIVAHSLGPALTCGLHGDDPDKLTYLSRTMVAFRDDNIFATAVTEWPRNEDDGKGQTKLDLTRKLALLIEEKHSQTGFHAAAEVHAHYSPRKEDIRRMARFRAVTEEEGRLDILLSEGTSESKDLTTPLAVIKVGRHTDEWWTKLDQIVKYIDIISEHEQEDPRLQFQEPLLCVVMTIDEEEETPEHLRGIPLLAHDWVPTIPDGASLVCSQLHAQGSLRGVWTVFASYCVVCKMEKGERQDLSVFEFPLLSRWRNCSKCHLSSNSRALYHSNAHREVTSPNMHWNRCFGVLILASAQPLGPMKFIWILDASLLSEKWKLSWTTPPKRKS